MACGILVSGPGIEPVPLTVKAQSPNHWATREFNYISHIFFFFLINFFIYFGLRWILVAARGLSFTCDEWGLLFVVVCGLLTVVASLVAEHGL